MIHTLSNGSSDHVNSPDSFLHAKRPKYDSNCISQSQLRYTSDLVDSDKLSLDTSLWVHGSDQSGECEILPSGGKRRVLIVPHNKLDEGVSDVKYWYPWLKSQLVNVCPSCQTIRD